MRLAFFSWQTHPHPLPPSCKRSHGPGLGYNSHTSHIPPLLTSKRRRKTGKETQGQKGQVRDSQPGGGDCAQGQGDFVGSDRSAFS